MDAIELPVPVEGAQQEVAPKAVFLERLKRNGAVAERLPIRQETLRLGRALDNDLIIDDPFVCPHHCRLFRQGDSLHLEDLASLNGTWIDGKHCKGEIRPVTARSSIRLGRSSLRLRRTDDRLPATWLDFSLHKPFRYLENRLFPLLIFALLFAYTLLGTWLESTRALEVRAVLPVMLTVLVLVISWSAVWSFSNRIVGHRWNLAIHAALSCLFLLGLDLWGMAVEYACFAFGLDGLATPLKYLGALLLLSALFYAQLGIISPKPHWRLARSGAIYATVLLALIIGSIEIQRSGFQATPKYQVLLKNPLFRVGNAGSSAEFFAEAERELQP